jgi:hypothetical protein
MDSTYIQYRGTSVARSRQAFIATSAQNQGHFGTFHVHIPYIYILSHYFKSFLIKFVFSNLSRSKENSTSVAPNMILMVSFQELIFKRPYCGRYSF